jgi:antirestriction protein ArdC
MPDNTSGRIVRPLRANGQPYKGINVLMLWGEALAQGFVSPFWMTYKQTQKLGGQVRKGEHGALVVYADRITKTETGDNGDEIEREIPFMKGYTVFCVEQIDGLPEHFYARPSPPLPAPERIAGAERFLCRDRGRYPPRRRARLLRRRTRLRADATLREFPRCREPRGDPRA